MQIHIDFHQRHVFVFGGTTGINFGIAQAFAARGAQVCVASRRRENAEAALAALAASFGDRASVHGVCAGGA